MESEMEELNEKNPANGGNISGALDNQSHIQQLDTGHIMDTNTHLTLNLKYRTTTAGQYTFGDVFRALTKNNKEYTFAFSSPIYKPENATFIGQLMTGSEIKTHDGKNLKTGYYWCQNGFENKKYKSIGLSKFRNKKGVGAKSVELINGITFEIDNSDFGSQLLDFAAFINDGFELFCITASGETNPEVLNAYYEAHVKGGATDAAFVAALQNGNVRNGKSAHGCIRIAPIAYPNEAQRNQYKYVCRLFALIFGGDLATCNLDRLMRAPGLHTFDSVTGELCVQPIIHFAPDAKEYTLNELQALLEAYIATKYENIDIQTALKALQIHNDLANPKRYNVRLLDPNGVLKVKLDEIKNNKIVSARDLKRLENIRTLSTFKNSLVTVYDLADFDRLNPKSVPSLAKNAKTNLLPRIVKSGSGSKKQYCSTKTPIYVVGQGETTMGDAIASGVPKIHCLCPFHGSSDKSKASAILNNDTPTKTLWCWSGCGRFTIDDSQIQDLTLSDEIDFDNVLCEGILETTYDYETTQRYPLEDLRRKVTILSGPCGVGKTYFTTQMMAKYLAQHRHNSLCHIVPRRILDDQAVIGYGDRGVVVESYKYNGGKVFNGNISICMDSFPKYILSQGEDNGDGTFSFLKKDDQGNLYIIMDEFTQSYNTLLAHNSLVSAQKAQNIVEKLRGLVQKETTYLVLLDADCDDIAIEMTKILFGVKDNDIEIRNFKNYEEKYSYRFLKTSFDLEIEVKKAISEGKKIAVACSTAKEAQTLHEALTKLFPNKKGWCVTQDTKEEMEKMGWSLAELDRPGAKCIQDCDWLIYSPTLQAGVSIVEPFDKMFFWGYVDHTRSTDVLQMTNRCRNINDKEIVGYIPANGAYKPVNPNTILAYDEIRRQRETGHLAAWGAKYLKKEIYDDLMSFSDNMPVDKDFRKLWVLNLSRNRSLGGDRCNLLAATIELFEKRGIEYTIQDEKDSIKNDKNTVVAIERDRVQIRKDLKDAETAQIINADDMTWEEAQAVREPKNKAEMYALKKAHIKHFFCKDEVDGDLLNHYKNKDKYKALARLMCVSEKSLDKIIRNDIKSRAYGAGRDAAENMIRIDLELRLLNALGIKQEVMLAVKRLMAWRDAAPDTIEYVELEKLKNEEIKLDKTKVNAFYQSLKNNKMKPFTHLGFFVAPVKDGKIEYPMRKVANLLEKAGLPVSSRRVRVAVPHDSLIIPQESCGTDREYDYFIALGELASWMDLAWAEYLRLRQPVIIVKADAAQTIIEVEDDAEQAKLAKAEEEEQVLLRLIDSWADEYNYGKDDSDDIKYQIYDMIDSENYCEE
jgi:hypothetical protein